MKKPPGYRERVDGRSLAIPPPCRITQMGDFPRFGCKLTLPGDVWLGVATSRMKGERPLGTPMSRKSCSPSLPRVARGVVPVWMDAQHFPHDAHASDPSVLDACSLLRTPT